MVIERLTDGRIGLRCDKCHKSRFFRSYNPIRGLEHFGWYVSGVNHNDTHICPECKQCYLCRYYNDATEPGTGICRATFERTYLTTRCFNGKFKPKETYGAEKEIFGKN